jgi:hypothetical protein
MITTMFGLVLAVCASARGWTANPDQTTNTDAAIRGSPIVTDLQGIALSFGVHCEENASS